MEHADKICGRCGRHFSWRPRWANVWNSVRYCSARCRKTRLSSDDVALELAIMELLSKRARQSTICPSEASRQVFGETDGLLAEAMQRTRSAARRLVAAGRLQILQKGHVVDPDTARGPIRLRALTPPKETS